MTITNVSYFVNGITHIPNSTDVSTSVEGVPDASGELKSFIDKHERLFLLNSIGVKLYDELQVDLNKLPFNPDATETAAQKWIDLVNGKTYEVNGKTKRWDGLRGFNGESVIAYYIYTEYLRNDSLLYTTTGVVKVNASNAKQYDPTPKFIKVHNEFIKFYQGDAIGFRQPTVLINSNGIVGLDYYGNDTNNLVSMLRFMLDTNESEEYTYPNLDDNFMYYDKQNSLGL